MAASQRTRPALAGVPLGEDDGAIDGAADVPAVGPAVADEVTMGCAVGLGEVLAVDGERLQAENASAIPTTVIFKSTR